MSWLRSAVNKAAEVSGGGKFRAAVRSYAGAVVHNAGYAVSEGAKKLQDRMVPRNVTSYKDTVRRLEEASVSSKGEDRVQLLKRWLLALRETERSDGGQVDGKSSEESPTTSDKNGSSTKRPEILYYDPDIGGSPMNFLDVFLRSQALEGMTMSMILGAPNEEENSLLLEIFGLCLTGGKEVHEEIIKNIKDLAKAFSVYDGELLAKREELLQFSQSAIAGLKVVPEVERIDSEVSEAQQGLTTMNYQKLSSDGNADSSKETSSAKLEAIRDPVAHIQLCCRLKSLLENKRLLNSGDISETRAHKVDKLRVLSESLLNSASKTEQCILDQRQQKKEAIDFRVARTSEVSQIEKDLGAEISMLEKQRDKLEADLEKVKRTLAAANTRLHNAREERLHFDEASNQILVHFKTKEDELSKTIASYRAEADTCNAFANFLEATLAFQSSFVEQKKKQIKDELKNHDNYSVNLATFLLHTYKDELESTIANMRKLLESLKRYEKTVDPDEEFLQDIEQRKKLEHEYLDAETKVIAIFDLVESIKDQFFTAFKDVSKEDVETVNELCDAIEKMKGDFKTIGRPVLRIENASKEKSERGSSKRPLASLKTVIGHKLLSRPQKSKAYVPLGGSAENSPSKKEEESPTGKNDQGKSHQPSSAKKSTEVDKEPEKEIETSRNSDMQETKDGKSSEPNTESAKGALEKETGVGTETEEGDQGKVSQETKTQEDEKSSQPHEEPAVEVKDGLSTEEVGGGESEEREKNPKDKES